VFFKIFDFDPDPEMDSDPEIPGKSDPEVIFSDPTHWSLLLRYIEVMRAFVLDLGWAKFCSYLSMYICSSLPLQSCYIFLYTVYKAIIWLISFEIFICTCFSILVQIF